MGFLRIGWRGALLALVLLGTLGTAAAASADGAFVYHQTLSGTADFNSEVNPCNGEPFTATARFTFSTTILETPSGAEIKSDFGEFSGSGVGATGARYVFETVGRLNSDVLYAGPDRQVQVLLNPTIHFIRIGEDGTQDDWFFHVTFIAIIDLDTLTVTHEVGHFFSDCR